MKKINFILTGLLFFALILSGCSNGDTGKNEDTNQTDVEFVKHNLNFGLTKEEVKELFGNQYQEISSSMDDSEMWRYSYSNKDDYKYKETSDMADIEGLKNGDLQMQLTIKWNENHTVDSFSALFTKDNDIYGYTVLSDGEVKEEKLKLNQ